jgi:DNA-binding MarR family transcriptional regulator
MTEPNPLVTTLQEAFGIFRRQMMRNLFVFARDNGLSMPQFGAMFHISHSAGCGISDIGSDLGITNSAASQLLDRLVQIKLISRTEDPEDRRAKLVVLTDKGHEILVNGNLANQKWLEALAQSMTPEEQLQVQQAIRILVDKARQLEAANEPAN